MPGARSATATSLPIPCARTVWKPGARLWLLRFTTCSRWGMAAVTTRRICGPCASRATLASRRSTETDGGKHLGCAPTDICATSRPVAARLRNLKDVHLDAVRRTRGNLAVLARGLGPLDLYYSFTGQRAGPTAHKVPESNRVLMLSPPIVPRRKRI